MTGRNKFIAGLLCFLIALQLPIGLLALIRAVLEPSNSLNYSSIRAWTHRPLGLLSPEIDLDPFKICIYGRWRPGELLFTNTTLAFGTPPPPVST